MVFYWGEFFDVVWMVIGCCGVWSGVYFGIVFDILFIVFFV